MDPEEAHKFAAGRFYEYLGRVGAYHLFRCIRGHEFTMSWETFSAGGHCRGCFDHGMGDSSLKAVGLVAQRRGGLLLTTLYRGYIIPMKFDCGNGHVFHLSAEGVFNGLWCGECQN